MPVGRISDRLFGGPDLKMSYRRNLTTSLDNLQNSVYGKFHWDLNILIRKRSAKITNTLVVLSISPKII